MIKKRNHKKKIIIIIFILFFFFSFFFQNNIKEFFYYIFSPVQKYFWTMGGKTYLIFENRDEFKELREENAHLLYKLKNIDICVEENKELKSALGLEIEKDFDLFFSQIVSKKISEDILIINKGKNDGIMENMPAITAEKILAGKITKTYDNFSEVSLISKKDFVTDVLIDNNLAITKGYGNFNLKIDMISSLSEPKKDSIVITSRMGGVFPEGLLVGKIELIEKNDTDFYFHGEVHPFININTVENLFIINKPVL